MVNNVSESTAAPPAATDPGPAAAGGKKLFHTPFGDVMVDEMSKPDFYGLFGGKPSSVPAAAQTEPNAPPAAPTLESVFGSHPWLDNPVGRGPNGTKWDFNPMYFATQETAEKVASLVGGQVVEKNDIITGGPFSQSAPNQIIRFADGREVNAGLIANFFNHGYPKSYIDTLLKQETEGKEL